MRTVRPASWATGSLPSSQGASAHTAVTFGAPAAASAARPPIECPSSTTGIPGCRSASAAVAHRASSSASRAGEFHPRTRYRNT